MTCKPWGPVDPNSQHQRWSQWTFTVYEGGRRVPVSEVQPNAARWLRQGFGSCGRAKVECRVVTLLLPDGQAHRVHGVVITAQVEGVPAHDPAYVASVRRQFLHNFVEKGWGPLAVGTVTVRLLAGDWQDGRPSQQLVVMPCLNGRTTRTS